VLSSAGSSELLDRGFVLKKDWDVIADWVDTLALVALQRILAAQHERLSANGAGEDFQQVRRDHGFLF